MHSIASFLLLFIALFDLVSGCQDGKGNTFGVFDLLKDKNKIHLLNVTLAVYDINKKPFCFDAAPVLRIPGYLKLATGQVQIVEPIKFKKSELRVQITAEHSSYFVGQVCLNGESVNAFVPGEMWSVYKKLQNICNFSEADFCKLVGDDTCNLLATAQIIDANRFYSDYFKLPEFGASDIGGEWKAEVGLSIRGKEVARFRVSKPGEWIRVKIGVDKRDEL